MKTTEEKVIKIIRSVKDIDYPITPDMSLTDDLFLESLDFVMLIQSLESSFKIDLGETDKIRTVKDIVRALEVQHKNR